MKRVIGSMLAVSLLLSGSAFAQQMPQQDRDRDHHEDRDHGRQDQHRPPQRGERLAEGRRGDHVADYKRHGLKRPPRGHEWRKVDDRYVLIAVATGLISSVVVPHH